MSIPTKYASDCNVERIKPLISPDVLIEQLPLDAATEQFIWQTREEIGRILRSTVSRRLLVVGPCSVHCIDSALEYAHKLRHLAHELRDRFLVVMRVYFEKPRTRTGWKGFINDPNLNGKHDINEGLSRARRLLLDINRLRVPCGVEFLDTVTPQYIADLTVWGAIGARTVESQVHRQLASGLSMPVGFKNCTYGYIDTAIDAVISARSPHSFMGITPQGIAGIVVTRGNPDGHIILRGGSKTGPNFREEFLTEYQTAISNAGIDCGIVVDCSHGNSEKHYLRQIEVSRYVTQRFEEYPNVRGLMIESNIYEGNQQLVLSQPPEYGVSVTDSCLSWTQTYKLLNPEHRVFSVSLTPERMGDKLSVSVELNATVDNALDFGLVLGKSQFYAVFLPVAVNPTNGRVNRPTVKMTRDVAERLVKVPFDNRKKALEFLEAFGMCLNVLEDRGEIATVLLSDHGMYYLPDKTTHLVGIVINTVESRIEHHSVFKL